MKKGSIRKYRIVRPSESKCYLCGKIYQKASWPVEHVCAKCMDKSKLLTMSQRKMWRYKKGLDDREVKAELAGKRIVHGE